MVNPRKLYRFTVRTEDEGLRLDQFISRSADDLSRGRARKLLDLGAVHVDGRRTRKAGTPVSKDMKIEVHEDGLGDRLYRITADHVLFEDPYLLVLNKPAGVETQPTPGRYKGTLYEALFVYLQRDTRFGRKAEIGMVQRLDRDTSGVILFSIHPRSHRSISHQFTARTIKKTYLALVEGTLDQDRGEFRSHLARVRKINRVKSVEKGGKEAITRFEVIQRLQDSTLVSIELLTGRSHQIRAHFSEAGHPLVGDQKYGGPKIIGHQKIERQMLHASMLRFDHPLEQRTLTVKAPVPADFHQVLLQQGGSVADILPKGYFS